MPDTETPEVREPPVIIKKYANRRLYNTATSRYVTLDQLSEMVKGGQCFAVYDAKTGEDITRSVLTQIIFEEEGKGQNLLPVRFLEQLIRMYGDAMQPFIPDYLETAMETFKKNQTAVREQFAGAINTIPALKPFEDIAKKNLALMEKAVQRFSPFEMAQKAKDTSLRASKPPAEREDEIAELKARIDAMQEQLERLAKKQKS